MTRNMGKVGGVAASGAGLALVAACGADPGAEPMTPDQIRSVLMGISEFPGSVDTSYEHFGDAPRDLSEDEHLVGATDTFGEDQCTEAMENIGGVDSDNTPQAAGERWVFMEYDLDDPDDGYPALRVSITSYEDEASVDEYWEEIQEACDGEVLDAEDSDYQEQVTLGATQIGEFRGLVEHWEWDGIGGDSESTHYGLSYAHGHQVIRIGATDLSQETMEEVLARQTELLEEGPQDQDGSDAADLENRDLPEDEMSSDELAQLVLQGEDFPFAVESAELDEGPDAFEVEYSPWSWALLSVLAPAYPADEEAMTSECEHHWREEAGDMIAENPSAEGLVLSTALQPERLDSASGAPAGAVVLLMSHEIQTQDPEAHWASFLDACAGEYEDERGTQVLEELDVDGVPGFTAHLTELDGEQTEELISHFAHLEFGHNSLRIVGIDLTTDQMREVVTAQLDKLEQAH